MTRAEVRLWGSTIGAVSLGEGQQTARFQYDASFAESGIELAPLVMPLRKRTYQFPDLSGKTFRGLPGLLCDSLPDKFGNAVIDQWLATQQRASASFDAVERLCYTGNRGIGALEFVPAMGQVKRRSESLQVDELVRLFSEVLAKRTALRGNFADTTRTQSLATILQVGTSAGGARAKAVLAWNPTTNEVRSGQLPADEGFSHWLLKFDGIAQNGDKELYDPQGFGVTEYAYSLMAKAAGITMTDCRILEENGRKHFMTRRFDRVNGGKLHMQSLAALAHFDFNLPGAYSYEQAFLVMKQLGIHADLLMPTIEEQFRRMLFNVVARNQDDHVKNIAFLMDRSGAWSLSPAFDVTFSFNPDGDWTSQHQMSINGKRDGFTLDDIRMCAKHISMKRGRAEIILEQVQTAVRRWPEFAAEAGVSEEFASEFSRHHRLCLPKGDR
jgi:serine/threonine-protein kinase HipA